MGNLKAVDLAAKLTLVSDSWAPRVVGRFNGRDLTLVRIEGALVWRTSPGADEFLYVLKGVLDIEMRGETLTLGAGEMFVVPAGVEFRPVAHGEVHLLLTGPAGPRGSGDGGPAVEPRWI